jgi:hypothetical protein
MPTLLELRAASAGRKAHRCSNAAALNQILVAKLNARSDLSPESN